MSSSSSSSSSAYIPTTFVPLGGPDYGEVETCPCPPPHPCYPPGTEKGSGGVRTVNGMVVLTTEVNLQTSGFGFPFSTQMEYDNLSGTPGWRPTQGLERLSFDAGRVLYKEGVNSEKLFLPTTGGNYQATYFVKDQLYYDSATSTYILTSPDGTVREYSGPTTSCLLQRVLTPGGIEVTFTYTGGAGSERLSTVSATYGAATWQFTYAYNVNNLLESIIQTVAGTNVRKLEYAYDSNNNIKTIKKLSPNGAGWNSAPIEACIYTYHTASPYRLQHVVTPTGYRQMINNGIADPEGQSASVIAQYAETTIHPVTPALE